MDLPTFFRRVFVTGINLEAFSYALLPILPKERFEARALLFVVKSNFVVPCHNEPTVIV